jgi:hypothetical protein
MAAKRFQDIQRDDMGEFSIAFGKNEAGNDFRGMHLSLLCRNIRDNTAGTLCLQVGFHLTPTIGDRFGEARLIHRHEGVEIGRPVWSQVKTGNGHGAGSQLENHGKNQRTL